MSKGKLLMISIDRKIFEPDSAVRWRQAQYARDWDEVHIVVFAKKPGGNEVSDSSLPTDDAGPLPPRRDEVSSFASQSRHLSPPATGAADAINTKSMDSANGAVGDSSRCDVIAPNCWAYSTESRSRLFYVFDAIRLGRFIVSRRGITDITCQDSFTAIVGMHLKKLFGVRLELQIHEDISSPYYVQNALRKLRKYLLISYIDRADRIRVVSQRIRKYLIDTLHVDDSKIEVRPISVDKEAIIKAPMTVDLHKKYPQFGKIVLMVGRLEREKNFESAIHSWQKVIKEIPNAGLVIVGDGSEMRKLRSLAERLGVEKSVVFEGWLERDEIFSYYKSADLFWNTSLSEGYGMTLAEAYAANCPIVSTDVGIAGEVNAVISTFSEDDMADKILKTI
ncbi:MAG: glycosyltransferase [Patescibacteria group bacterium]|nr:glycosyltransferase [Patescibacteria group bacterium]